MKRALITGITGQDGQHLAKLLIESGDYEVYGMIRGQANVKEAGLRAEFPSLKLVQGDLMDSSSLVDVLTKVQPDEVYNLGGISFVAMSWQQPELTHQVTGLGPLRMLEAIRIVCGPENPRRIRFYQASSSEMFGKVQQSIQNEQTPFYPRSPYGVAKMTGHWTVVNHRESYNMFACSGILFNHEGERRGLEFVTRKITDGIARIHLGLQEELSLGNLDSKRDWGYAGDYVRAMWLMLQQDEPGDYVVATGEMHTVREFVELSCKAVGINLAWEGSGVDEVGRDTKTGKIIIRINPVFFRPAEVDYLIGDATKAHKVLGWKPEVSFNELVEKMIAADVARLQAGMKKSA
jgi:GDPmannose 4,6-dehydratase